MNRFRILLSLFVAIGAVVFALRYRSLNQLQTEQAQLREQADRGRLHRGAEVQGRRAR